jgi:hypothetical protein
MGSSGQPSPPLSPSSPKATNLVLPAATALSPNQESALPTESNQPLLKDATTPGVGFVKLLPRFQFVVTKLAPPSRSFHRLNPLAPKPSCDNIHSALMSECRRTLLYQPGYHTRAALLLHHCQPRPPANALPFRTSSVCIRFWFIVVIFSLYLETTSSN